MELKIEEENLAFLGGFLNALSLLDDNLKSNTLTALVLYNFQPNQKNILDFYELNSSVEKIEENTIQFFEIEKVFKNYFLHNPKSFLNGDKEKIEYLSYKFMDYLCFCFHEYDDDLLDFSNIYWQDFQLELKNQSARFLALPLDNYQTLMITFWQKSH